VRSAGGRLKGFSGELGRRLALSAFFRDWDFRSCVMRVCVWGINYRPEQTGIAPFNTGLCEYLVSRGHEVEMVTTFSYYPSWRKEPADSGRWFRTDRLAGVTVHRCWHHVPGRVTTRRRIIHELSFAATSFVRLLFVARPDVYVVVSPPLLLGPMISILAWLKRRPFVFHVQDLQPDAAVGLGLVAPGRFARLLFRAEAWTYRNAAVVSGISRRMVDAFARKEVPTAKLCFFPNWIQRSFRTGGRERMARDFREKHAVPANAFLASYSGNLGRKQGLEILIEAAQKLSSGRSKEIWFLIAGDGAMRAGPCREIGRVGAEQHPAVAPVERVGLPRVAGGLRRRVNHAGQGRG
jgi:colanic acid biosynthesis glycosyl transferase WcaI